MSFSFVIIPDTQIAAWKHPELLVGMAQWIVDQRESRNIGMVLHLGDVVHHGAADEQQFRDAKAALERIDSAGIPQLIVPGNHDYDNMLREDRSLDRFNDYFGGSRLEGKPWLGGTYEPGRAENSYAQVEVGGTKLLFIGLEFGPRDEVLAWTDGLLARYADHKAIIATHCYMYHDATRNKPGDAHNPKIYAGASGANDGEDMWNKCFRRHRNVAAIYSGHQIPHAISYSVDFGDGGNPVFQSFQNWQMGELGGEGRIRLVAVNEKNGMLELEHSVVNPQSNEVEAGDGHDVSFCCREPAAGDRSEWERLKFIPAPKA